MENKRQHLVATLIGKSKIWCKNGDRSKDYLFYLDDNDRGFGRVLEGSGAFNLYWDATEDKFWLEGEDMGGYEISEDGRLVRGEGFSLELINFDSLPAPQG